MENTYFVDYKLYDMTKNEWISKTTSLATDLPTAEEDYHTQFSEYTGGTTFNFVSITLSDMYGNIIMHEFWQSETVENKTTK